MHSVPRVRLGYDGILRIACPQDFHLTLDVMRSVHRQHVQITTEERPLLVYADPVASAEPETQQFAPGGEAMALSESPAGRLNPRLPDTLAEHLEEVLQVQNDFFPCFD
jgi:hypothetical protein